VQKQMQRYKIFYLIAATFLNPLSQSFSQKIDNQLNIIKNTRQYRNVSDSIGQQFMQPLDGFISPLFFEVPYQTKNNFTGKKLYRNHKFWVLAEAGEKLKLIQDSLQKIGLTLYFFDTYRPYSVTKKMWKIVPDERYAANPVNGSGHNRGGAIDLTLADATTGAPLPMPTGYDNFSDTAHHGFSDLPEKIIKNRDLLKGVMEHFGFKALSTEWWHYSLPNAKQYPLMDLSFRDLEKLNRRNQTR
jgi:zinc D-Ala-D-Ala dipeptidase